LRIATDPLNVFLRNKVLQQNIQSHAEVGVPIILCCWDQAAVLVVVAEELVVAAGFGDTKPVFRDLRA